MHAMATVRWAVEPSRYGIPCISLHKNYFNELKQRTPYKFIDIADNKERNI